VEKMSIKVKSVMVESPMEFQTFYDFYLPTSGVLLEHSPIYTEITAEVSISGSLTVANIDYDYSYTGSKTWTRIPIAGDSASSGMITIGVPYASIAPFVYPEPGEFIMGLLPALETPLPLYVPQYPAAILFFDAFDTSIETSAVIGTRTNNNVSPPVVTDIVADVGATPGFIFTYPTADFRQIIDVLSIAGGANDPYGYAVNAQLDEDLTVWSPAKWRDFRGTYTATETSNGITTTVDVTFA
jgi:hypothetical protein